MPSADAASSIETLLAAHRAELVAFVERRLGSRAVADDVVQQTAVRALVASNGLRDARAGRAWLFRITRRLVADHLRARAQAPLLDDLARDDDAAEFGCACVLANLEQLKPEFAQILRRVVFDAASLSTVASELGMTANTATVRLSRARTALKERLRVHCGTNSLRACLTCTCEERGCCVRKARSTA
jgi:RNA polymerase sigma-70 factor (ECF subfamily)